MNNINISCMRNQGKEAEYYSQQPHNPQPILEAGNRLPIQIALAVENLFSPEETIWNDRDLVSNLQREKFMCCQNFSEKIAWGGFSFVGLGILRK